MDEIASTNKDQDTFIRLLRVMVTGQWDKATLALRMPNLSSVRWLSCATRILRVYISTERPSYILERMVNYIVYVYGQVWLQAKHNPSLTNGSFHLHQEISLVEKHCTEAEKEILRPSIQRNSCPP